MGFTVQQKAAFDILYKAATHMSGNDARLVQLKDDIIECMMVAGVAKHKYMHPKSIAPHPKNRGGSKMQWGKIYSKGAKIIKVGVSLNECGPNKAVAFEDRTNSFGNAHVELCKTSPHYAEFTDRQAVEAGSVGCGHWNQFLACIIDARPVPERFRKQLCEEGNPNLDGVRLGRDQPSLRKILDDGLKWTIISHQIERDYPELPNILQKALNIEHHIGEGHILLVRFMYKKNSAK